MGLPEEDRGPAWLRDWGSKTGHTELDTFSGYVDPDALAVDIKSLTKFAEALLAEHENDYRPHVQTVFDGMSAAPAQPDIRFIELTEGMTHHRDMLVQTSTALANHDKAVIAFINAAKAISEEYRTADAMSAASVTDVEANLTVAPSQTGTGDPITPQQASEQTSTPVTTTGDNGSGTSPDGGEEYPNA